MRKKQVSYFFKKKLLEQRQVLLSTAVKTTVKNSPNINRRISTKKRTKVKIILKEDKEPVID